MIWTLNKLGIEGNLIKAIYKKLTANILNGERMDISPPQI